MYMHFKTTLLALSLSLGLVGCGDDDRGEADSGMPDGGTPGVDGGMGSDAGPPDTEAPTVIGTDPDEGDTGVMPRPISVFFSEAMDDGGSVTLTADGDAVEATTRWEDDAHLVVEGELPMPAEIQLVLEGFTDLADNAMATFTLDFETADVTAPYVISSDPSEGDVGVDPELTTIRLETSEPLATDAGAVALIGGPGSATGFVLEESAIVVTVEGLAADTAYELVPSGFTDGAGNALDTVRTLGDGALDFRTASDDTAPIVLDASPSEGEVDVSIGLTAINVTFSEAMDTSVGSAVLVGGGDTRSLDTTWREGGTVARFALGDILEVDTSYSLTLVGFVDASSNALDRITYLGDGAIDFTTGEDIFDPYVVGSAPAEGETDVPYLTNFITVAFSEAMDTSVDTATLVSSRGTNDLTGTWSPSGTSLTFEVGEFLVASKEYSLDLTGFADADGSPLDASHFYLGDGVLQFSTVTATGERCRDELDESNATEIMPGVYEWTIADDAVSTIDGTMSCDVETSPDAVLRFTKTSDDSVLRVQTSSTDEMNVQVLQGLCDSRSDEVDAARLRCLENAMTHGANVEGPAGDYYFWVARTSSLSFEPTTVTIEELPTAPEGETCAAPLTTGSSRYYTAPAAAGEFHTWTIPMDGVYGYDRGLEEDDEDDFECVTERGADAVVEIPKTTSSSILEIQVESMGAVYEILDGACEPGAATQVSCEPAGTTTETQFVVGDARSVFVWAAGDERGVFDGSITVRAREVEPGPGESCGTAYDLSLGDNAVTPDGVLTIDAPSCTGGAITWYRFTATTSLTFVTGNGFVPVGVVDADTAEEVRCSADPTVGVPAFTVPGRDYCVAVTSGGATTNVALEAIDYPGVTGNTVTDLNITAFDTGSSFNNAFDPEDWLVVTPSQIYLGSDSDRFIQAPRSGGVEATQLFEDSSVHGEAAVTIGEAVFGVDDSRSGENRLYRYVDSTGTLGVTAWDTGSTYVNAGIDSLAYDGTVLLMASSREFSSPPPITFYSADPDTPGPVTELGSNDSLTDVSALQADDEWLYIVGAVAGTEGVYRLRRSDLGNPAATVEELPVGGLSLNHSDNNAGLALQPATGPGTHAVLYFRTYGDHTVYAILDPGSDTPRFLGAINTDGRNNDDYVLALDPAVPALFITEEATDISNPRFLRIE